jgi:hypothetical protein
VFTPGVGEIVLRGTSVPLDVQVSEMLKAWSDDEEKESPAPKRSWRWFRSAEQQTQTATPDPNLPKKRQAVLEELARLNKQRRRIPRVVGLFLILFFASYAGGIITGGNAEVYQ